MKPILLIFLSSILGFTSFAQAKFEKGYFLNDKDEKIDCLIKNENWLDSPSEISYKLSAETPAERLQLTSIKEFGILEKLKYQRFRVGIDLSSDQYSRLSNKL